MDGNIEIRKARAKAQKSASCADRFSNSQSKALTHKSKMAGIVIRQPEFSRSCSQLRLNLQLKYHHLPTWEYILIFSLWTLGIAARWQPKRELLGSTPQRALRSAHISTVWSKNIIQQDPLLTAWLLSQTDVLQSNVLLLFQKLTTRELFSNLFLSHITVRIHKVKRVRTAFCVSRCCRTLAHRRCCGWIRNNLEIRSNCELQKNQDYPSLSAKPRIMAQNLFSFRGFARLCVVEITFWVIISSIYREHSTSIHRGFCRCRA